MASVTALAACSADAMFLFDCLTNQVIDRVDPITHFGKPSAHLHAVSGGSGFSTTAERAAMTKSTCTCPIGADLSAYSVPQMYVEQQGIPNAKYLTACAGMYGGKR